MLIPKTLANITVADLDSAYQQYDFSSDMVGIGFDYFQILALGSFSIGQSIVVKEGESNLKGSVRATAQFVAGDGSTNGAIIWIKSEQYINWKKVNSV